MNNYRERAKKCIETTRGCLKAMVTCEKLDAADTNLEEFDRIVQVKNLEDKIVWFLESGENLPCNDFLSITVTPSSIGEGYTLHDRISGEYISLDDKVEW